jgi:asparagine synthase (glutamine-hydrolysing)
MCGLSGVVGGGGDLRAITAAMTGTLAHRGPDDAGLFVDDAAGVALGHRRLAIVDTSACGHQPMASASGRYRVAYNGEIYNFRALAAELAARGHRFRGHSDTEVLLAAVEEWGLDAAVPRFVGIFAFALYDARERCVWLARDHLGVKPLYYAHVGGGVAFASELRALERHPGFPRDVDRGALALLLRHACVPAPHTIYAAARKLPAATVLRLPVDAPAAAGEPRRYWSAAGVAAAGARAPFAGDAREAADALDALLRDAVGLQMLADVPLGAFLSGGVDSSAVVALMQAQSAAPVRTFSIGFEDSAFDEAGHARAVAAHLGTAHTELRLSDADARAAVPLMADVYDEPFADSSQVPTYLVSRLARGAVTVSLSGDGGDELFGGYNRHVWAERLWRRARFMPARARRAVGRALAAVPAHTWDRGAGVVGAAVGRGRVPRQFGHALHRVADVLAADDAARVYTNLVSHWKRPGDVVAGAVEPRGPLAAAAAEAAGLSLTEQMMLFDLLTYLPDDILVKVDRASMAVGLEARVPLLDHRVVEFAWRLPLSLKVRGGVGKRVLRDVLYRYVPRALIERPKAGFAVPLAAWLRGPLREWADDLLAPDALAGHGLFDVATVRRAWDDHRSGRRDRHHQLWAVLAFESWRRARAR